MRYALFLFLPFLLIADPHEGTEPSPRKQRFSAPEVAAKLLKLNDIRKMVQEQGEFDVQIVVGSTLAEQMMAQLNSFLRSPEGRSFLRRNRHAVLHPPTTEQAKAALMANMRAELLDWDRQHGNILSRLGLTDKNIFTELRDFAKRQDLPPLNLTVWYPRDSMKSWSRKVADAAAQVLHSQMAMSKGFRSNGVVDGVIRRGSRGKAILQGAYSSHRNAELRKFEHLATGLLEHEFRRSIDPNSRLDVRAMNSQTEEARSRIDFIGTDPTTRQRSAYYTHYLERLDDEGPALLREQLEEHAGDRIGY